MQPVFRIVQYLQKEVGNTVDIGENTVTESVRMVDFFTL